MIVFSGIGMADQIDEGFDLVCWTRMQSEAGQGLQKIVRRKELERRAGAGLFFWGVGNAPAVATGALARVGAGVPVIFSVMKSKPKAHDVAPERVVGWQRYVDVYGTVRDLPPHVLVTSRPSSRGCHFALICRSETPLSIGDHGPFDPSAYRNFGGTGAPVGNSQVTALLRRHGPSGETPYRVTMQAVLADSFWVKIVDPFPLSDRQRAEIDSADELEPSGWSDLVARIKRSAHPAERRLPGSEAPSLFPI